MRRLPILLLSLGLSLVACRGGGDDGGGDDTTPDAPPVGGSVTIQEVQADSMPVGTAVELDGVVVTAIDAFGARTGDLWVEEPGGGEFSGIKVFGAPLDQIASLAPGDIVTIANAEKDEFALMTDMTGRKVTEIKGAGGGMLSIVKTGSGALPPIATVDAVAIDALADQAAKDAEWEKWEGVLVKVVNARQTSAVSGFGGMAEDQQEFRATGDIRVQSAMTALGADAVAGTCYAGITGVADYFFNHLVLPTAATDLLGGGTGCAAQTVATVADIQMGTATGAVQLENVFVTARDDIGTSKGVWVADTLAGAQFNGVFVFTGSNLDATLEVGAKVNVLGSVTEFDVGNPKMGDTVTEINQAAVTLVAAPAGAPTPLTSTANLVGDIGAGGEPFEGVLVSVSTVKVTNNNLGNGKIEVTDNNGAKLVLDDDLFALNAFPPQTNGACLNVVGVMHVQLTDNLRTLLPRTTADVTTGTGCN